MPRVPSRAADHAERSRVGAFTVAWRCLVAAGLVLSAASVLTSVLLAIAVKHRAATDADRSATQAAATLARRVESVRKAGAMSQCVAGNVTRAYLQLRAREFPIAIHQKPSVTTRLSPDVFPLINCDLFAKTGERDGLSDLETQRYLRVFNEGYLPKTKDGVVVGRGSFGDLA